MTRSLKRPDYKKHTFSRREALAEILKGIFLTFFFSWFFYRSVWALLPLSALGALYVRRRRELRAKEDRDALLGEFKECILSAAASLRAGYAAENAFLESMSDMKLLFGESSLMYRELEWIHRGLVINIPLEELLSDLAQRSGLEEIEEFAEVFAISKHSGGSLPEIIGVSAEVIGRRVEAEEEIRTLLAERMLEQKIMSIMPFGILTYIGISYKGYFDALYHNLFGIAVMTVCLAVYLAALWLADRILENVYQKGR